MGTISLPQRFQTCLPSAFVVAALIFCASAATMSQELAPPANESINSAIPLPPVDEVSDESLTPYTILPPPGDASDALVGAPLPPVDAEPPGGGDALLPDPTALPPAFVPQTVEQPAMVGPAKSAADGVDTSALGPNFGAAATAPSQTHLDRVFPSLPGPSPNTVKEGPQLLLEQAKDVRVPAADANPRVAQYGDPGIAFSGPPQMDREQPSHGIMSDQPQGWWQAYVGNPMRNTSMPRPVSINGLVAAALQYSSQVKVISDSPLIRDTAIIEADAAFDWSTFMETAWNEINEPVGSTLTTGGPPRFRDSRFDFEAGLRRQTGVGGRFEAGQRYGYEDSNSVFFVPNDQGTSRMTLSYTQPLLRGAGRPYNTSLIVLAQIDSAIARDDFSRQLQEHLLEITRSYWALYLERASLLQRQRLYDRGREILQQLEYRESIDAVTNQIVRARAAVASRKSDLFRAAAAVKNAEGRIRALVNAPDLGVLDEFELTPRDMPTTQLIPVDMRESLEMAIRSRPEVNVAMKQIKGSALRLKMSKNELLPILDVVLETYVAGLKGNSDIGTSFTQQFNEGGPSYTAGLQFEVPLRNRAARARFQRRNLEMRQFENQFRNTLQALQLEVEIAVREVHTSFREIEANSQAMNAAHAEVDYIAQRWELLPGEDRSASLVLEDLLAAQERLAAEEFELANSQVNYNLSLTNLKRTMGTLLQFEQVAVVKGEENGIPALWLHKADAPDGGVIETALEFGPE